MCKEMPVISVNRVVDPKRIIGKYGGLRRRRGTRGRGPPKKVHDIFNKKCLISRIVTNKKLSSLCTNLYF
jgi:hypothetical protein